MEFPELDCANSTEKRKEFSPFPCIAFKIKITPPLNFEKVDIRIITDFLFLLIATSGGMWEKV